MNDYRELWTFARENDTEEHLKRLHMQSALRTAMAVATDWSLILAAWSAVLIWGWIAVLPALIIIGNRQRALVVLIHEASHNNLFASPAWNTRFGDAFLACPMLNTIRHYRRLHAAHHKFLGKPELDTDYLHSEIDMQIGWFRMYRKQLFDRGNLQTALIGSLPFLAAREVAAVCFWWVMVAGLLVLLAGLQGAAIFLVLWLLARVTVYHAIINFVIVSDHAGLAPGTVLGFTRNHPSKGIVKELLHPHENGWHLVHHLMPSLPWHALPKAHRLLLGWESYAASEHCKTYFWGSNSVVRSWCGATRAAKYARKSIVNKTGDGPRNNA